MKAARRKLEVPMPAAMPCKIPIKGSGKTHRSIGKRKTKYACAVDADVSTRPRIERAVHKHHQDHITEKRDEFCESSQSSYASSDENSRCKGSSAEGMGKLEKILAWQLTKVRNKKEVVDEARKKGNKVHVASLMNLCHLKNSELEPKYQKCKGRVVLRGDIVKDDPGSYAVFTEQSSSASQNDGSKSHGYHFQTARMFRSSSWCSIRLYAAQNGRCINVFFSKQNSVRMYRYWDTYTETQMAKIIVQYGRSSRSSRKEFVRSPWCKPIVWKAIWERRAHI